MPHLSPMSWLLIPMTMWLLLLLIMSINWWSQSPKLPLIVSSKPMTLNNYWNWI